MHTEPTSKSINSNKNEELGFYRWEYDGDSKCYTNIDASFSELTGYSPEECLQANFRFAIIHQDDIDWINHKPKGSNRFHKEYRITTKNNGLIWVRDTINIDIRANNKIVMHGHMIDITDQKAVETAMQTLATSAPNDGNSDFFYECVKNISHVYHAKYAFIGLLNRDRNTVSTLAVWANNEKADNFEYDLEGTPCQDIIRLVKELIPTNVQALYPQDVLLQHMGVDSYFGTPLTNDNGDMIGLIAILDDNPMQLTSWTAPVLSLFSRRISVELEKRDQHENLIKMIEIAEAANRAKSDFLANISHELRTPMHAIMGFSSQGIRRIDKVDSDKILSYFTHINNSASNLLHLLNNLLDISKLESGKFDIIKSKNCINHRLENCISEQQLSIKNNSLTIEISPNENIEAFHFDANKISQVISNLLSNSIKFSPAGGKIEIKMDVSNNESGKIFTFKIIDQGPGIPDAELLNVFDKFVQSSRTNTGAGGSGLGLAICQNIIESHNGKIWAQSSESNETGAILIFELPMES